MLERKAMRDPVELGAVAKLPTAHGDFDIRVFIGAVDDKEHVALVRGHVFGKDDVLTRLHSECMTGDVFASLRCDCRQQLERGRHNRRYMETKAARSGHLMQIGGRDAE